MFHQAENEGNIEDITFIVETTDKNLEEVDICMSLHNGLSLRCLYWLVTSDAPVPVPTHIQFVVVA